MSGWRPADGEVLTGRIVALDFAMSKQDGEPYPLVIIAPDGDVDEVTVHGHHRVLKEELAKRAPRVGDRISITYLGEVTPTGGGRAYAAYRVEGGSNPFTWNMFRPADDQLPVEHATGQAPPAADVAAPAAPAPAAPAAPAAAPVDVTDRVDPADEVAIRKLLDAAKQVSKIWGAKLERTLNDGAGGPWDVHLTAERGAKALTWLMAEVAKDVDVNGTLAREEASR